MPGKQWEDEEDSSSSGESAPKVGAIPVRRSKFDDEEGEDSDVLESWDAAEDSEVEREKAKKAAEAKAKADAAAAAAKKSKAQRVAEHQQRRKEEAEETDSDEEETEAQRRERMRRTEKESDLRHAEALFGDFGDIGGVPSTRTANKAGAAVVVDPKDPNNTVNLNALPLFNPTTKAQFEQLRTVLGPMLAGLSKKPHYSLFLEEFAKQLAKDLSSEQIKKISSKLTTLSNEKLKEEKAADKGGKKTKAAKTKVSLVASRAPVAADTKSYEEDGFGDDDFM